MIMKKILLALLVCAGVASCKDDDPGTEPPKPKVSLTEGTSTTTSITFTVTPDEAEKCAYLYSKVEENAQVEQPSAETVLKDGVQVSAEQATPVTLSPLDPESTYIVFAAASNGSVLSEVTTLRMETGLLPEPDYETWVQATSSMGQYNTISWAAEPTGNYMVQFSDIEFDEYGEAQSAGYKIVLDLYGSLTDDVMNPTIPQGTYQFDAEDSYTHFTFQKSYSNIYQTDDQGYPIGYGLYITGGSLTVKTNEDGYSVVGYLTDEEGHTYKVSYEGPMVIANKTGGTGSNQTIENPSLLLARYYGDLDHANTGNYYLSVGTVTVDPDDPFTTTSSGWQVILDFWDQKSADDDNAILPEGTYDLADTHAARTINYEETRIMHYYLTGKTPEMAEFDYSDASVQVEHVAGGYKLTGHFVLEDGNSVDFVYEGPIDFENLAEPLIGNVNETFTIAKGEYLGDYNSVGNDNYTLHLYTDEAQSTFINIDLNAQTATNLRYPVIPDGNYDAGVPDSYETGTFTPGHLLYGSYLSGTTVGRKVNGEVSAYSFITAGTISFTYNEADETYDIRVNATTSDNFTVEGTFHGKIELENTLLGTRSRQYQLPSQLRPQRILLRTAKRLLQVLPDVQRHRDGRYHERNLSGQHGGGALHPVRHLYRHARRRIRPAAAGRHVHNERQQTGRDLEYGCRRTHIRRFRKPNQRVVRRRNDRHRATGRRLSADARCRNAARGNIPLHIQRIVPDNGLHHVRSSHAARILCKRQSRHAR